MVGQNLTAPWTLRVLEVDASDWGGGVVETRATLAEVRRESRWAARGGWAVWTGREPWRPNLPLDESDEDVAEEPGVVRLAAGSEVRLPVYRFLHLFSGHRRHQDLEYYLMQGAARRGWILAVTNYDLGYGSRFDLSNEGVVAALREQVSAGLFDGLHTGTPCSMWSAARWSPGGPPPLRSSDEPWGMASLSRKWLLHVELHNQLMDASFTLLEAMAGAGGTATKEHPASRGRPPFASVWDTARWKALAQRMRRLTGGRFDQVSFPQCALGATSRKPTTVAFVGIDAASWRELRCTHSQHAPLIGLAADGSFRTKEAQAYPPGLCQRLAEAHLGAWESRAPLCGEERAASLLPSAPAAAVGSRLQVPEVSHCWDAVGRWRLLFKWAWATVEHNNVLEMRAALRAVETLARDGKVWGHRAIIISDSQAVVGALSKGRSSRPVFNQLCRRQAAVTLGLGIKFYWRYVRTSRNVADGPSRNQPLGVVAAAPDLLRVDGEPEEAMPEHFKAIAG